METPFIKTAESIALLAHGELYFDHSKRVALKDKNESEIVLGYLHDVIEDSELFDYDILSKIYKIPDSILTSLHAITRDKNKETYFDYIKRLSTDELARQVKIYDLEDHLYYKEAIPASLIQRYEKALCFLQNKI